ncbi:MAG: acyl-CoA carboxylase subunit beta [Deltaproteobacteria bacterium]|nr:acyl-CoA carboxylase subunit beta [Deltaproteobacteria bacterium]
MANDASVREKRAEIRRGGAPKYHESNTKQGKLFARERIARLFDEGSFVEDGAFANCRAEGLPADGVITGTGTIGGRRVCAMANDSTIKAGSWGARTVEKILRIQETAMRLQCPMVYLVDSAGARITDQIDMFPGRRHAGRIFYHQVAMSGQVPQICLLFGPSAAGGAYIPAFCDIVVMVDKNASMYLGSPRMAEMVIGEKVSLEELGGARMHCSVSGCGDVLAKTEPDAIAYCQRWLAMMPQSFREKAPAAPPRAPKAGRAIADIVPVDENKPFDMFEVIDTLIDEDSFVEVKERFAKEMITGLARIDGRVVGVVANQPKHKGGVLFVDSADKAARFIWLCDAYNIPLLYLADVPGFMIGTIVERQGIIRAGAKMIAAVSEATVPKISVVVRKAYGAGLYAMCGPAFEPDACLALPTASIAVMGPSAAVNAVYYNKIQEVPEGPERDRMVESLRDEYRADVDLEKLASELVIDDIVPADELRGELVRRYANIAERRGLRPEKKHLVPPV